MHLRERSDSIPTKQIQHSTEAMNSIRHLRKVLIVATACCGATAFAESEGERALRLENERQLNEMNMRIMIRNREEDDALRVRAEAQRNAVQRDAQSDQAVEGVNARRKALIEKAALKIGAPIRSSYEFDWSEIARAQTDGPVKQKLNPVKLVAWPHIPGKELDATSVVRDHNVVQFVLVGKAEMDGIFSSWRINATCGPGKPQMLAVGGFLASDKTRAALRARDSLALPRSGPEYVPINATTRKAVQVLCETARKTHHPILIPTTVSSHFAELVPARSIRRERDNVAGWIRAIGNDLPSSVVSVKAPDSAQTKELSYTEARFVGGPMYAQLVLRCGVDSLPALADVGLTDLGVHVYSALDAKESAHRFVGRDASKEMAFFCAAAGISS